MRIEPHLVHFETNETQMTVYRRMFLQLAEAVFADPNLTAAPIRF
jgi:hypothetical protein